MRLFNRAALRNFSAPTLDIAQSCRSRAENEQRGNHFEQLRSKARKDTQENPLTSRDSSMRRSFLLQSTDIEPHFTPSTLSLGISDRDRFDEAEHHSIRFSGGEKKNPKQFIDQQKKKKKEFSVTFDPKIGFENFSEQSLSLIHISEPTRRS